jgi:hypothetical protein
MIVALTALVVALGGTSWAASKIVANSVGPRELRTGAVGRAEIKSNAIVSRHVARNSLTGDDVAESRLGTVPDSEKLDGKDGSDYVLKADKAPNAELLDGIDSAGFVHGRATSAFQRVGMVFGDAPRTLMVFSGIGTLQGLCAAGARPTLQFLNQSGKEIDATGEIRDSSVPASYLSVPNNGAFAITSGVAGDNKVERMFFQIGAGLGSVSDKHLISISATTISSPNGDDTCRFQAIATWMRSSGDPPAIQVP